MKSLADVLKEISIDESEMYCVYGLLHPGTEELRYVGKTKVRKLRRRLNTHVSETLRGNNSHTHKNRWIMKMHRENKKPVMVILSGFFASETAVYEEEKRLIAKYQNLTNATKGGEGLSGHVFSAEHKNKFRKL